MNQVQQQRWHSWKQMLPSMQKLTWGTQVAMMESFGFWSCVTNPKRHLGVKLFLVRVPDAKGGDLSSFSCFADPLLHQLKLMRHNEMSNSTFDWMWREIAVTACLEHWNQDNNFPFTLLVLPMTCGWCALETHRDKKKELSHLLKKSVWLQAWKHVQWNCLCKLEWNAMQNSNIISKTSRTTTLAILLACQWAFQGSWNCTWLWENWHVVSSFRCCCCLKWTQRHMSLHFLSCLPTIKSHYNSWWQAKTSNWCIHKAWQRTASSLVSIFAQNVPSQTCKIGCLCEHATPTMWSEGLVNAWRSCN